MVNECDSSANYMKMSRQPTFYKTFPILDDHYNSNFKWVDVKGKFKSGFGLGLDLTEGDCMA